MHRYFTLLVYNKHASCHNNTDNNYNLAHGEHDNQLAICGRVMDDLRPAIRDIWYQ